MIKLISIVIQTSFQILSLALLFTSACTPADAKLEVQENIMVGLKEDKPDVDIHTAILTDNYDALLKHISLGSDLNVKEPMSGSTPLMTTITFDKMKMMKALIDAEVDLSIKNNDGSTALHTAAFFGRIEMVQLLIDAKADKTIKNNFGATPRETVMGDFEAVKPFYEMLILQLKPMGFTLDLKEVQEARPVVAMMLQ